MSTPTAGRGSLEQSTSPERDPLGEAFTAIQMLAQRDHTDDPRVDPTAECHPLADATGYVLDKVKFTDGLPKGIQEIEVSTCSIRGDEPSRLVPSAMMTWRTVGGSEWGVELYQLHDGNHASHGVMANGELGFDQRDGWFATMLADQAKTFGSQL